LSRKGAGPAGAGGPGRDEVGGPLDGAASGVVRISMRLKRPHRDSGGPAESGRSLGGTPLGRSRTGIGERSIDG